MKFSMSDWQLLQVALERGRAESADLYERISFAKDPHDIGWILDSTPSSGITCQSPAPSNIQPIFGNDRTSNLLKNRG
jgi:hypothetical protein